MNKDKLIKGIVSLTLAGSFVLAAGAFSTANAQGRHRERQRRVEQPRRNRSYGPVESTGNIDRNRNGIDDRYEARGQVDINQNGIPDNQERYNRYGRNRGYNVNRGYYGNGGYYGYNGYYGNRGVYGYNNSDYQRGYRDGLDRGREDALTHRAMTPNNSSHYRSGNPSYRAGFERGFYQSYQQYRGRRW